MTKKEEGAGKWEPKVGDHIANQVRGKRMDLFSQAQEKVKRKVEEQKTRGVKELAGMAEVIRYAGQHLRGRQKDSIAHYTDQAAETIDRAIQYVESRDVSEILKEAQSLARRHPEAFWGGAFLVGLLAGRFFKSSNESDYRESVSGADKKPVRVETITTTV